MSSMAEPGKLVEYSGGVDILSKGRHMFEQASKMSREALMPRLKSECEMRNGHLPPQRKVMALLTMWDPEVDKATLPSPRKIRPGEMGSR